MGHTDRKLAAHLARRAGFGATVDELDSYENMDYDELVDHFLNPGSIQHVEDALIYRRYPTIHAHLHHNPGQWGLRMLTTNAPLLEKITLFWHGIFATAETKLNNFGAAHNQINMFREHGLGTFDNLLLELSRDPAMLVWLDNQTNHKDEINENYGREILELFSMGVGNYTEDDIKECARAFTGWAIGNSEYMTMMGIKDSIWPYGRIVTHFEFNAEDHDNGTKTFLGETGNFNGDDVIRIICKQDATARFVARHMYSFFVSDEVPVPQWQNVPPKDPEAIELLKKTYIDSNYSIKEMLRVLFNSEFFKGSQFTRVKSPTELIMNTLRSTQEFYDVQADTPIWHLMEEGGFMGQKLTNPPSVEGWHTGDEWITSGSLVDRVNFASRYLSDPDNVGVRRMIDKIKAAVTGQSTIREFIDLCLSSLGELEVDSRTYESLTMIVEESGFGYRQSDDDLEDTILKVFRVVSSSREFQMC